MNSLRQVRKKHGLTLEAVKEQIGMAIPGLSRIENGLTTPDRITRELLEGFYGERINWLDTPHIITSPRYPTDWDQVEREFRSFIRLTAGLPESDRVEFISTCCRHLRRLKKSKLYIKQINCE